MCIRDSLFLAAGLLEDEVGLGHREGLPPDAPVRGIRELVPAGAVQGAPLVLHREFAHLLEIRTARPPRRMLRQAVSVRWPE
eukprot:1792351-Alexandrium_andersonii.AAC.1